MKSFLDENFLLNNKTGQLLYHNIASKQPIIDYHCHINPQEIAMDRTFENITQLWLGGDHYKWRLMRADGVDESLITGDAPDKDKFFAWVHTLQKAIGNPLYHWSHLELKRYFNYDGVLCDETANEVWELTKRICQAGQISARKLMIQSNVELICTTDDPIDDLRWHKQIKEDDTFTIAVLPTWRPDRAMNLEMDDYLDYVHQLELLTQSHINNYADLMEALRKRITYFDELGCVISDHGPAHVYAKTVSDQEVFNIFEKRINGKCLDTDEIEQFKSRILYDLTQEYHLRGWVVQLHYNCLRNNNTNMHKTIGADTGFDAINDISDAKCLSHFLDNLAKEGRLPKMIVYSLNAKDNDMIDSILACFQDGSTKGKMQHGSAWWFNDHKNGMNAHLESLAQNGLLANFIGMLTDSRSFLSYTRHEYFRRILCNKIGEWVENGEYPFHERLLEELVVAICYQNAKEYITLL